MSDTSTSAEVLRTQSPSAQPPATPIQPPFDQKLAQPFIYKSVSAETRAAYHRAIREFFHFVGGVHPVLVTPAQVILYRDHLTVNKRRKANTVATKLAIVRSFFEYLKAAGIIPLNPASTKLVAPPELPTGKCCKGYFGKRKAVERFSSRRYLEEIQDKLRLPR